ncbi:hypothetical protein FGO68_gene11597 [Halteria grandinella]|uniref:Uncharacterized protein n=1 Tax=Halteria grandinella TaxID=5974 RepID=A0A8J8NQ75_HALGN|nr:hypothetical protein FGO68_gene11597 [Halteria grandinella]
MSVQLIFPTTRTENFIRYDFEGETGIETESNIAKELMKGVYAASDAQASTSASSGTLYDRFFKGSVQYSYDSRIDDYNWPFIFGLILGSYLLILYLAKRYLPEPGPKKEFLEKGKMKDYHFYYFQVTSMIHALIGCITQLCFSHVGTATTKKITSGI